MRHFLNCYQSAQGSSCCMTVPLLRTTVCLFSWVMERTEVRPSPVCWPHGLLAIIPPGDAITSVGWASVDRDWKPNCLLCKSLVVPQCLPNWVLYTCFITHVSCIPCGRGGGGSPRGQGGENLNCIPAEGDFFCPPPPIISHKFATCLKICLWPPCNY